MYNAVSSDLSQEKQFYTCIEVCCHLKALVGHLQIHSKKEHISTITTVLNICIFKTNIFFFNCRSSLGTSAYLKLWYSSLRWNCQGHHSVPHPQLPGFGSPHLPMDPLLIPAGRNTENFYITWLSIVRRPDNKKSVTISI